MISTIRSGSRKLTKATNRTLPQTQQHYLHNFYARVVSTKLSPNRNDVSSRDNKSPTSSICLDQLPFTPNGTTIQNLTEHALASHSTHNVAKSKACIHPINAAIQMPPHYASIRNFSTKGYNDDDSWEQPFDSSQSDNTKPSNRSQFKSLPIDQSILSHIRSIGVGIRPKNKKKKRKSNRNRTTGRGNGNVLDESDEEAFFNAKHGGMNHPRRQRPRKSEGVGYDTNPNFSVMPPPPFSNQFARNMEGKETDEDALERGQKIKRLPVKVLGSVSSLAEEMPRSSKGLPEVALVGRSNVGKSTLLNALLYGNQFEQQVENRRYRRGKTPVGAMIGKGIKAKVSDRPGETKSITFYQLSAQTLSQERTMGKTTSANPGSNTNASSVSENASASNRKKKKKISLILADLPGFGFAYANEERAKDWQELMKSYILHRGKSLKRVLFLIDARHGFKKTDFEFLEILQDGLKETKDGKRELPPIQMVLTKCDLVSQNDLARRMVQTRTQLSSVLRREPSALPIMLVSARAGLGFNNVRGNRARGGVLELQRELAALVPKH